MAKQRWVIVANSSYARFFKMKTIHDLEEVQTLVHTESRLRNGEINTDKEGMTADIFGDKHNKAQQAIEPKKQEALTFARQVADALESIRNQNGVERFYVAASPMFLGMMRQSMSQETRNLVAREVDKDITHLKPSEIPKYFVV